MFLTKIVFAVFVCTFVTNHVFVSCQEETTEPPDDKTEPPPLENHTFVALLEILFVDGSKRRCTGTIIHDNVVITAAHCFLHHGKEYVEVELSGSFIVIGTKKMFDTGYENYLPIERIITHPQYKGWTADLALVYTFAGMTTDKTGNVLPIVEENETPVDSNVTILSWGNCCDEENLTATKGPGDSKKRQCTSSEEKKDSCERPRRKPLRKGSFSTEQNSAEIRTGQRLNSNNSPHRSFKIAKENSSTTVILPTLTTLSSDKGRTTKISQVLFRDKKRDESEETRESKEFKASKVSKLSKLSKESKEFKESKEHHERRKVNKPNESTKSKEGLHKLVLSIGSPYLIPAQVNNKDDATESLNLKKRRYVKAYRDESIVKKTNSDNNEEEDWSDVLRTVIQRSGLNSSINGNNLTHPGLKSRRRLTKLQSPKDNKLTVETFGFVNVQTCKKLIDKALPSKYRINTNEVVCYAAEEHYISDDDSGAPAVREGRLVAVTVGGAECEGDHIAIGMKMTCYCTWIVENLPPGDNKLDCCTDCCGEENNENDKKKHKKRDEKDHTYLRSRYLRQKHKHHIKTKN